jgi:preprotein translocase subunit SecD
MRLLPAMAWMAGTLWAQNATQRPVTLRVHLLVACGTPGAGAQVKVQGQAASLCLDRTPFLTQNDVESAEIQPGAQGRTRVFLTFHEEAARRELQVTLKNIGNRVGIVLNGRVVGTPTITAASRLLYIDDSFTKEQAEAVVGAFNRRLYPAK